MTASFLSLPVEIRLQIYRHLLGPQHALRNVLILPRGGICICFDADEHALGCAGSNRASTYFQLPSVSTQHLAILRTCRQSYNEALTLLYAGWNFCLGQANARAWRPLSEFLVPLSAHARDSIRSFQFHFGLSLAPTWLPSLLETCGSQLGSLRQVTLFLRDSLHDLATSCQPENHEWMIKPLAALPRQVHVTIRFHDLARRNLDRDGGDLLSRLDKLVSFIWGGVQELHTRTDRKADVRGPDSCGSSSVSTSEQPTRMLTRDDGLVYKLNQHTVIPIREAGLRVS